VAPHILGREVPLLLAGDGDAGPVGVSIGSIDLLYRDPEDDALVVVDYKTDALEGEQELEARVTTYAAQGSVYVDAVKQFTSEASTVRFELWFLTMDRVVQVEPTELP
jgi:ATP-dependent exoDNAse (exonuclease V) beta subunit